MPLIECTSRRSASFGSFPMRRFRRVRSAAASASEKVASSTRLSGCARVRCTARCSATMVLPVPAEPETRAGPLYYRSTSCRWAGCRKTPLLPGAVQRSLQRLHVRHHPEAALRVRMRERIGARHGRRRAVRRTAGRKLQQRLGGLARQMIGEVEQRVLRRGAHVIQPLDRHAVAEQIVFRRVGEDGCPRRRWSAGHPVLAGRRDVHLHIPWHPNLTHRLTDLDELRSSCRGMSFQPPSFCPLVRGVVMVDVAEQEARRRPVDDQPDVATDPNGPEVLVLRPVDLVQLQPRMRRVHLQVERRGLDRLLLVAGQLREAVGEGVGDAELHSYRRFPQSSRSRSTRIMLVISGSMNIVSICARPTFLRAICECRLAGRTRHVRQARSCFLSLDVSENRLQVIVEPCCESVPRRAYLGHDGIIPHCPPPRPP